MVLWKIGLPLIALAAIVLFRNQIGSLFGQAGTAIGAGAGQGVTNALNSFSEALKQGTAGWGKFLDEGGLSQWNKPTSNTSKTYVPNTVKLGSSGSTKTDTVVTPQIREYSDSAKSFFSAWNKQWS